MIKTFCDYCGKEITTFPHSKSFINLKFNGKEHVIIGDYCIYWENHC